MLALLLSLSLILAWACSTTSVNGPGPVTQVSVSPTGATLTSIGDTVRFTATGKDAAGNAVANVSVTWSSANEAVATVNQSGLATAVASGSAEIRATISGVVGSGNLSVNQAVAAVAVTPSSGELNSISDTLRFTAAAKDSKNNAVSGVNFVWSSSNTSVATIDPSTGLATAKEGGTTVITASAGSVNGVANLTIALVLPGFYVSPSGTPTGNGSIKTPWDLATALAHPSAVVPGQNTMTLPNGAGGTVQATVIWLRGGSYGSTGAVFSPTLSGNATNPVVLAEFPSERATVNGRWTLLNSPHLWLWGFESFNSTTDLSQDLMGFDVRSEGMRLINLVVHDHLGNGIGFWANAPNSEVYGCIIYNNGRKTSGDPFAHGIYIQNQTGSKLFADSYLFHNLDFDLHGFGSDQAFLQNVTLKRIVFINTGQINKGWVWKAGSMANAVFDSILGWSGATFGNLGADAGDADLLTFTNAYLKVRSIGLARFSALKFTDNQVFGIVEHRLFLPGTVFPSSPTYDYDRNGYWLVTGEQATPFRVWKDGVSDGSRSWDQWRAASGYDQNSTFMENATGTPGTTKVFVLKNEYEPGRANIIIFNWQGLGAANVDVSSVLTSGDKYEVRHVFDFYGTPVATGTYGGGTISIPVTAVAPPAPITGWPASAPPTPGPNFGAFVLRRVVQTGQTAPLR